MANFEKLGECKFGNLINGVGDLPRLTVLRTALAGQGILKRGTALALNADDKLVILGTDGATANCVLAKDVDTTEGDAACVVYISGQFNRNSLTVKDGYTITADDVEDFRKVNIAIANSVE